MQDKLSRCNRPQPRRKSLNPDGRRVFLTEVGLARDFQLNCEPRRIGNTSRPQQCLKIGTVEVYEDLRGVRIIIAQPACGCTYVACEGGHFTRPSRRILALQQRRSNAKKIRRVYDLSMSSRFARATRSSSCCLRTSLCAASLSPVSSHHFDVHAPEYPPTGTT